MADYLLDTNHLSPLVTLTHPLHGHVLQRMQAGDTFAIVMPALTEFLFGIGLLPRATENHSIWGLLADRFVYYNVSVEDVTFAAELQINLRKRGKQLETIDALIATIAIRYNLILLTTDRDFEPIPELKQENWVLNFLP